MVGPPAAPDSRHHAALGRAQRPISHRLGGVAQWKSIGFASRGSRVRVPSPPPACLTAFGGEMHELAASGRSFYFATGAPAIAGVSGSLTIRVCVRLASERCCDRAVPIVERNASWQPTASARPRRFNRKSMCGQDSKGGRGMFWRRPTMKDVVDCDKPRGAVSERRFGDF